MAPLKCVITVALFLIAIHINVCLAQEVEKPSTARDKGTLAVQGTWLWQHKGKNKSTTCELTIAKKEGMFHCVLKAGKKQYESKKGLLINGVFTVTFSVADSDKKYSFRGKLNKGKMTGEYYAPSTGTEPLKWVASRTISLQGAAGRWQLFFETPDGQVQEPAFELFSTKDEPNVEFTEGPEMDIRETRYKNGVLNVVADIEFQGQGITVEYELEFKKDELDGLIYFEVQATGDQGEIEVEGVRTK